MEFISELNNFIPPSVAFIMGAIGVICFFILMLKKPKNKKTEILLTGGYVLGGLGFIPLMITIIAG